MEFEYFARTKEGESQNGIIEASNETAALRALQRENLIILSLQVKTKKPLFSRNITFFGLIGRIKGKEIFIFFRQLAILVEADVPLIESLRGLTQQVSSRALKEIIMKIADDIDAGSSFSKALSKYPKVFSTFSVSLVKTGEVSGQLQESLTYLADYLEKQYYINSKVRGAMIYPAFILFVVVVVAILIMTMVIPSLTSVLLESGQELPLSTRVVIAVSNFLVAWWWLLIITVGAVIAFVGRYIRTSLGQLQFDGIKLKLPVFAMIFKEVCLARLADTLAVLIKGGLSILQSLEVAAEVVGNKIYEKIILEARDELKAGKTVSSVLEQHKEFPSIFCQMVKIGEKTGKLDSTLSKLSAFYSKEVENIVNNLSQLIEPVLLIFLALMVAVLVFAVFMPLYSMVGAI